MLACTFSLKSKQILIIALAAMAMLSSCDSMVASWVGNSRARENILPQDPVASAEPVLKVANFETSVPAGYPITGQATLENAIGSVIFSIVNSTCDGLEINTSNGSVSGDYGAASGGVCTYQIRANNGSKNFDSDPISVNITSSLVLGFSEPTVMLVKGGGPKTVLLNLSAPAPFSTKLRYQLFSNKGTPTAIYGFNSSGTIDVQAGVSQIPIALEFKSFSALNTNDSQVLRIDTGSQNLLPSLSIQLSTSVLPAFTRVCSGAQHTCAIGDGKLYCWGYNGAAQVGIASFNDTQKTPVQIGSSTTWQELSCGSNYSCGINAGQLFCWGSTGSQLGIGATPWVPGPIQVGVSTTWQKISTGDVHTCGIDAGSLYCWGTGGVGQIGSGVISTGYSSSTPVHIGSSTTWTHIAAGDLETCGIDAGKLYCWGYDNVGQQGNGSGSSATVYAPVQLGSLTNWQDIAISALAAASSVVCGIESGNLYCWGSDIYGKVGNGSASSANVTSPLQIGTAATWTQVRSGSDSICGIMGGELYCWGNNNYSILGVAPTVADTSFPIRVGSAADWTAVTVGSLNVCGLRGTNLYCWGTNSSHGLGLGNVTPDDVVTPEYVDEATDWQEIATSSGVSCGIKTGRLYCWGHNFYFRLGTGSTKSLYNYESSPSKIGLGNQWTRVTSGNSHSCAINSGKLFCWGRNNYGQTGDGSTSAFSGVSVPTRIGALTNWTTVSNGTLHSCGIAGGELYCWGMDGYGQVGNGVASSANVLTPEKIGTSSSWTAVSSGNYHTCGINGGQLYCWGYDDHGQQANGAGLTTNVTSPTLVDSSTNWEKLAGGGSFSCGIKGGALFCWGLDIGTATDVHLPTQIGSSTTWREIVASDSNTCGIDNGLLFCWGADTYGQIGNGATTGTIASPTQIGSLTNWQKVSSSTHTCGIESGRLLCWGSNQDLQLGRTIIPSYPIQAVDF